VNSNGNCEYVYVLYLQTHGGGNPKIVSNLVQLLGEWSELFPYDFREERMMGHVRAITEKCVSIDPTVGKKFCYKSLYYYQILWVWMVDGGKSSSDRKRAKNKVCNPI